MQIFFIFMKYFYSCGKQALLKLFRRLVALLNKLGEIIFNYGRLFEQHLLRVVYAAVARQVIKGSTRSFHHQKICNLLQSDYLHSGAGHDSAGYNANYSPYFALITCEKILVHKRVVTDLEELLHPPESTEE